MWAGTSTGVCVLLSSPDPMDLKESTSFYYSEKEWGCDGILYSDKNLLFLTQTFKWLS